MPRIIRLSSSFQQSRFIDSMRSFVCHFAKKNMYSPKRAATWFIHFYSYHSLMSFACRLHSSQFCCCRHCRSLNELNLSSFMLSSICNYALIYSYVSIVQIRVLFCRFFLQQIFCRRFDFISPFVVSVVCRCQSKAEA